MTITDIIAWLIVGLGGILTVLDVLIWLTERHTIAGVNALNRLVGILMALAVVAALMVALSPYM